MSRPTKSFAWLRGLIFDAQLATGTAAAGDVPVSDGAGGRAWGPGVVGVTVVYATASSPIVTSATINATNRQPLTSFSDHAGATISGALPAAIGLSYASPALTATRDGVFALHLGFDLNNAPGDAGIIQLETPNNGYSPRYEVAVSGNPDAGQIDIVCAAHSGDVIRVAQWSPTGASVSLMTYLTLDILRIADTVG